MARMHGCMQVIDSVNIARSDTYWERLSSDFHEKWGHQHDCQSAQSFVVFCSVVSQFFVDEVRSRSEHNDELISCTYVPFHHFLRDGR